jgi:hypothetical protein
MDDFRSEWLGIALAERLCAGGFDLPARLVHQAHQKILSSRPV